MDATSTAARRRVRPEHLLLGAACVVMVVTGSVAAAVALFFLGVLVPAIRDWPRGTDVGQLQIRAAITVACLAGLAIAVALEAWVPAAVLLLAAALAAPRPWVRSVTGGSTRPAETVDPPA